MLYQKNQMLTHKEQIPAALHDFVTEETIVVKSPGRINLIGEHTDYNEGFVLPAAIDKAAYVALTPKDDNVIELVSIDLKKQYKTTIEAIAKTSESWPNYLLGPVAQFINSGHKLKGFRAALTSDVPIGAGLSSSAAVECAMAKALNILIGAGLSNMQLVQLAQKAEHEYAGVQCGIMDQFASVFGKKDHVIKLDCRSLQYDYLPFKMRDFKVVLFDTKVHHALSDGGYNNRRNACEEGVAMIQRHEPQVTSLRDVTLAMLKEYVLPESHLVYQRCAYVVEEIQRLLEGCKDLERGDIEAFGKKMYATHKGLSEQYEVSCKELDFLVDQVKNNNNVLGARMMGGGFGGCTINLIKNDAIDKIVEQVSNSYYKTTRNNLGVYITKLENGTQQLT